VSVRVNFIGPVIPRPPLVDGQAATVFFRLGFTVSVPDFTSRIYQSQCEATVMFKGEKFVGPPAFRIFIPIGPPVG
jgi:hypothetical protein